MEHGYDEQARDNAQEKTNTVSGKGYLIRDILESVAIAVVLAVIIKVFLFQNFVIPSGSMEPTLFKGDMLYVSKISYRFSEPVRGDIVVFKYPLDPKRDFVKRIMGMPGETLEIKNSVVHINGQPVSEPFLRKGLKSPDFGPVKINEGQYFMMGDNRDNSSDSRVWGTVPRKNFVGKAVFIYWPPGRIGALH